MSSSPGPSLLIQRRSLGVAVAQGAFEVSLADIHLEAGGFLVVVAQALGRTEGLTLTYRGYVLVPDAKETTLSGVSLPCRVQIHSDPFSAGKTGDIVLHAAGGLPATLVLQAIQVTGLAVGTADQVQTAAGMATMPDTGATAPLASFQEYGQSAFALAQPGSSSWENGFSSGGQDVTPMVLQQAALASEGYRIPGESVAPLRAILAASVACWAGVLVTYR